MVATFIIVLLIIANFSLVLVANSLTATLAAAQGTGAMLSKETGVASKTGSVTLPMTPVAARRRRMKTVLGRRMLSVAGMDGKVGLEAMNDLYATGKPMVSMAVFNEGMPAYGAPIPGPSPEPATPGFVSFSDPTPPPPLPPFPPHPSPPPPSPPTVGRRLQAAPATGTFVMPEIKTKNAQMGDVVSTPPVTAMSTKMEEFVVADINEGPRSPCLPRGV